MPADYQPYDERQLQTPEQRAEALRELFKRVFFESADFAMSQQDAMFASQAPVEFGKQSIRNFRKVEKIITSHPSSEIAEPEEVEP